MLGTVLVLPLVLALTAPAPIPAAAPAPATPSPPVTPTPVTTTSSADVAPVAVSPVAPPAPEPAPVFVAPPVYTPIAPTPVPAPSKPSTPRERSPFFAAEPVSETAFPNGPRLADPPRFSLGRGAFCFVDDATCRTSLVLTADVGIGTNLFGGRNPDLPYAQFNFRGGFVMKPLMIGHKDTWHPWGVGLVGSWSRGTGSPAGGKTPDGTPHTDAWRVLLVNQLWLSKKRNGFHLDLDLGIVRSTVFARTGRYYGTHAGLSANWGGWGGLFMAADLLDHDTRIVFGFRANGLAAAPAIGLVLLGLLAGGAFGGAS
jgi:hypothetical protein